VSAPRELLLALRERAAAGERWRGEYDRTRHETSKSGISEESGGGGRRKARGGTGGEIGGGGRIGGTEMKTAAEHTEAKHNHASTYLHSDRRPRPGPAPLRHASPFRRRQSIRLRAQPSSLPSAGASRRSSSAVNPSLCPSRATRCLPPRPSAHSSSPPACPRAHRIFSSRPGYRTPRGPPHLPGPGRPAVPRSGSSPSQRRRRWPPGSPAVGTSRERAVGGI